jgi:hypothetical protein
VPQGSTSSPVLEEGGVFLLAPSRSLCLPSIGTRAGMCRVPGRRIGVWSNRAIGAPLGLGVLVALGGILIIMAYLSE